MNTMCLVSINSMSSGWKWQYRWLNMLGLIHNTGGHLQATITLTFGQHKRIKYFTPSYLFYKAFLSPQWFQLGSSTVFCDAFKRGSKLKGCWGETMSALALRLLFSKKAQRIREKQSLTLSLLVVFCFIFVHMPVSLIFTFFFSLKNNNEYCYVLRGQRFIGQDTRADHWNVLWGSDPNDHLVNIWCYLTWRSGLHNSTRTLYVTMVVALGFQARLMVHNWFCFRTEVWPPPCSPIHYMTQQDLNPSLKSSLNKCVGQGQVTLRR